MSEYTPIEWCDSSINPTSGCDGCEIYDTCYARDIHEHRLAKSYPHLYATHFREVRLIAGRMEKAARWKDLRGVERKRKPWIPKELPRLVFISDMSDALSQAVPFEFLKAEVIDIVAKWPHIGIWVTKRPERMAQFDAWLQSQGVDWPANLWALTSITSQPKAERRIPELFKVRAAVRGLSCEPLLGALDLHFELSVIDRKQCGLSDDPLAATLLQQSIQEGRGDAPRMISWVICGGESGDKARPMHPGWARSLRDQATRNRIPFFFKQWGEWSPNGSDYPNAERSPKDQYLQGDTDYQLDGFRVYRIGSANDSRRLDDKHWNEFPAAA